MDMSKMIFITGFARGGTSWLRDCVAAHPDVQMIPQEMVVFRDFNGSREYVESKIEEAIIENDLKAKFFVNKAPANAPFIKKACKVFPESKFLYIIRDPRDVLVSHKRGTKAWMGGKNSTVEGCMKKISAYWKGYESAEGYPNIKLIRYEDLHQSFESALMSIYDFLKLPYDHSLIEKRSQSLNFFALTGRRIEDRDAARRKGVVGDWANHLDDGEKKFYQKKSLWSNFLEKYNYRYEPITYRGVLQAMKSGGVHCLSEKEVLELKIHTNRPNLFILHDLDYLAVKKARQQVLQCAAMEGELGFGGLYNFLPLDDIRYGKASSEILHTLKKIQEINPAASIGLHLNATEKYFPMDMPDVGEDHPDITKAIEYLHKQIDDYSGQGVTFKIATSHGYGRGNRRPNNQSIIFLNELDSRGIALFDKGLSRRIRRNSCHNIRINDVGGALTIKRLTNSGEIDDPETYRRLSPGSLILLLVHPGNYDMNRPLTLRFRKDAPYKTVVSADDI